MRNITLSTEYVKGCENFEADRESRLKNYDSDWMLDPIVLGKHVNYPFFQTLIYLLLE